jgi:hypothetical protein
MWLLNKNLIKFNIVLVHLSVVVVVVEVVKQIRQAIIKMSNYTKNKEQKESKESELYNFITNDNFVGRIEEIHFVQDRLLSLQEKEEKNHQTM